jgi:DNA-binding NtrC family response regulator
LKSKKVLINLDRYLSQIEVHWIKEALRISNRSRKNAAELLCLNRTTLVEKMRKYGLLKKIPPRKR